MVMLEKGPREVRGSLSELSLRVSYSSYNVGLVSSFYTPCLERAVLYRCAVGYFTSHGLAAAAKGGGIT